MDIAFTIVKKDEDILINLCNIHKKSKFTRGQHFNTLDANVIKMCTI